MYFILSKRIKKAHFKQVGVVIADSLEEAVEKLNYDIEEKWSPPEADCVGCSLNLKGENKYPKHTFFLEEIKEIDSILFQKEDDVSFI